MDTMSFFVGMLAEAVCLTIIIMAWKSWEDQIDE